MLEVVEERKKSEEAQLGEGHGLLGCKGRNDRDDVKSGRSWMGVKSASAIVAYKYR